MDRRDFLRASSAAVLGFGLPTEVFAQTPTRTDPQWDAGSLRHLLPQVSDKEMLIKASFSAPMLEAPTLRVGDLSQADPAYNELKASCTSCHADYRDHD